MVNLKDFIIGNETLYTTAFQQAVDYCYNKGGEPLFIPFGTYTLGTVILRDNTTLIFEDGAKILGSKNIDDFLVDDTPLNAYQDMSHSSYTRSLFYAKNAKNITIKGNGVIDMQSAWDNENKRNSKHRGAKVIAFDNVEGVVLQDFKILYATDIAILLGRCKDCFVTRLYIETHIDGISPDGSTDVVISDCILKCGDDGIVLKSSYYDNELVACERITVTNCIVSSRCSAIKLGTESNGDFRYITISNCVVHNTRCAGLAIESCDGGNINGVTISNITMQNVACPIFIFLGKRMRGPKHLKEGSINNLSISNIYADCHESVYKSIDFYYDLIKDGTDISNVSFPSLIINYTENQMKNISISNANIKCFGGKKLDGAEFKDNPCGYPSHEMFGFHLPAYALIVKNCKGLKLDNVNFELINADERPESIIE